MKWAKGDGFLAEDFDIVLLVSLRSVQEKSIEEEIVEHIGKEMYKQVKMSAGSRCLLILEGLDEMSTDRRENDPFLKQVIKCTLLEEAIIIITSRPHACEELDAGRRIEVVGFGKKDIQEFVKKSFLNDVECAKEFLQQLKEYPHLESLSYVPMNLKMIIDIFECSEKKLPSTITQLYQLFIVMTLNLQIKKRNSRKQVCSDLPASNSAQQTLREMLAGVPKESTATVLLLCRLAYLGFFRWHSNRGWREKDPKIIFAAADLKECGIEVTAEWDGYGLLKATHTHQLPTDTITYTFSHLTIQEFLCAIYIATVPQEEQLYLIREHFKYYPNVFIFLCGLTKLASDEMFKIIFSRLRGHFVTDIIAMKCLYESQQNITPQPVEPIAFWMNINDSLLPYDCLCISHVLSICPIPMLIMDWCHLGDKGAELLVKNYPGKSIISQPLTKLTLTSNNLTIDGLSHIMKILKASK